MRTTTFDMIAMLLMAVAVLLVTAGGIVWAYLGEQRRRGRERTTSRSARPANRLTTPR